MPGVDPALTDEPRVLAMAARAHLRERVPRAPGWRSAARTSRVAETGTLAVVESEGNGRMCLTLPQTLITVMGIEKLVPTWRDLEVFLQLLPRSSTGERMNPYTSLWTGVTPGDGPQDVPPGAARQRPDGGPRRRGRAARRCTASAARPASTSAPSTSAPAATPTARSTPGPIGAVLTPQLTGIDGRRRRHAPLRLVAVRRLLRRLPRRRSTSRSCWCTCAAEHVEAQSADDRRLPPSGLRWRAVVGHGRPRRLRRWRSALRAGRFLARGRPRSAALPAAAVGVDRVPRPARHRRSETFRQWWAGAGARTGRRRGAR